MKEHVYYVAAYLRLSREDEDIDGSEKPETPSGHTSVPGPAPVKARECSRKAESNSISSQRELIRSYVREHEDMELFDIYTEMKIA